MCRKGTNHYAKNKGKYALFFTPHSLAVALFLLNLYVL